MMSLLIISGLKWVIEFNNDKFNAIIELKFKLKSFNKFQLESYTKPQSEP